MMNGTGIRLPTTAAHRAAQGGRPSAVPKGMPPRSSTTGIMETSRVKTISPSRLSVSHCSRFTQNTSQTCWHRLAHHTRKAMARPPRG